MKPLTIQQPYKATGTAGHSVEEWLAMTPIQQAEAHIHVMRDTARKWAGVQWRESMGVPATVPADAQTLLRLCDAALQAIQDSDPAAMLLAMKATAQAAELNRWPAIDKALTLQRSANTLRSSGGKATAKKRQNDAQKEYEKIVRRYLALQHQDERSRVGIIADATGYSVSKVRRALKKAGIR